MRLLFPRLTSSASRKIGLAAGALALLVGVAHGLAGLVIPDAVWSGPVGLRKPAVFGISIGLTLWSVVWIISHLRDQPRLHAVILHGMSATLLLELAIIAGQRLRDVPSHFNLATGFDAALWGTMGAAIGVFVLLAFLLAALAWRPSSAPSGILSAIRGSLLIFAAAQISGQLLAVHGTNAVFIDGRFMAENLASASTFGTAGNLKLPHALALHAIQVIPLLGVLFSRLTLPTALSTLAVWTATAGFAGLVALMQAQALLGRAPTDLSSPAAMALGVALTLLLLPWCVALAALARGGVLSLGHTNPQRHA